MKNYSNLILTAIFVFATALGCGLIGDSGSAPVANSNKTLSDRAIDSTVGRSKVGVPECDQVLEAIEAEANDPDDNFVVKAAKAAVLNQIKEGIRQAIEENANKGDLVSTCREFKDQFDKYKAEQQTAKDKPRQPNL